METQLQSVKILVIEDDEDDYIIMEELLREIDTKDFIITWANDYDRALKLLQEEGYDICMLDYRLGAHDGLEILNELSALETDVPVVFLTGQGEYRVDVLAMEAGAADYLVKDSLTSSLLERSIRYTIDRATAARALRRSHEKLEETVRQRTSQLIDANNELKKASEKIQTFAFSISHDLKSPATALYALTRRLRDRYREILGEKGELYCDQILAVSGHILSLVENINLFISEKEMPLNIENLDLNAVLNEIQSEFSDKIVTRNINWDVPGELPFIRADHLSILRILRNLIENAFKYGGENLSYIGIKFEESMNAYTISVSDDGPGFNTDQDANVFLPFQRIGMNKSIEGSGLGLAIVKEIAEKHGGEVWTSHDNGKGATFCFSISKFI